MVISVLCFNRDFRYSKIVQPVIILDNQVLTVHSYRHFWCAKNPLWRLNHTDNICSRYLTESGEHYLRHSNESLEVVGSDISHNNGEALFVDSPHWSLHESNISEITFVINGSLVTDNGRGVLQFSRWDIHRLRACLIFINLPENHTVN